MRTEGAALWLVAALTAAAGCSIETSALWTSDRGPPDGGGRDASPDGGARLREVVDDTFDDFRQGDLGASAANLYVRADGTIAPVLRWDADGDGLADLPVPSYFDGLTYDLDSRVYLGGDDGFDETRVVLLPTHSAMGVVMADLDADGWTDLLFPNHYHASAATHDIATFVYWGSPSGFDPARRAELETRAAYAAEVADLDRDGWLDVIVASHHRTLPVPPVQVFWGGPGRFAFPRASDLPAPTATDVCPGDFDGDGWVDLFLPRFADGATLGTPSALIRFDASGPLPPVLFPTAGAFGCAVADLDRDGHLDVVVTQFTDDTGLAVPSLIFHGGEGGPSPDAPTELAVSYPGHPRVADFDRDGWLDVFLPSSASAGTVATDSPVYFGGAAGFRPLTYVAGLGPYDADVRDFDGDGHLDLWLANRVDTLSRYGPPMTLYPGQTGVPFGAAAAELPASGPVALVARDWGHVADRRADERFVSRVIDLGGPAAVERLSWDAVGPPGSRVRLQLRSARTVAELGAARWTGPSGAGDWYDASPADVGSLHGRWVQYRAELRFTAAGGPRLERVTLSVRD